MLAIGTLTRLSGIDATLGLAFAGTGVLYPFFGTLLGWLGVALTGSDTASNILFGNLQKITAQQLGLSPILMAAANSSGGVMGKMIDAQSIVVASTATNWFGHEGTILRRIQALDRPRVPGRRSRNAPSLRLHWHDREVKGLRSGANQPCIERCRAFSWPRLYSPAKAPPEREPCPKQPSRSNSAKLPLTI
jgi:hypothetical protein